MGSTAAADLCSVLSETQRITNAHSRHFLALSVLFILPLSFLLSVYPIIQNIISQSSTLRSKILLSHATFYQDDLSNLFTTNTIILSLLLVLLSVTFSLFATGSITYSVIHGFYGRPVKLCSSIKSSLTSFLPLLITNSFAEIIFLGVVLLFALFFFLVMNGIQLLGFEVNVSSPSFQVFCLILGVFLVLVLFYLQLNWVLAQVIVVAESIWGLEPLKRSNFLIKGMKGVALSLFLCLAFFPGLFVIAISFPWGDLDNGNIDSAWKIWVDSAWKIWPFVVRILVPSALQTMLFLYNIAAFTVLYMDCTAVHRELVWEIAEEFAGDYVSLPFDDGKIPHFVSVTYS
ncbi:PREDICTED: uncharacterized protein LOC105116863 [Populus euphratica]|uniref:Uncharacterized protein LOC105116863 n=1 Tax=Populus euphratica TaxID=75702 RepID=A0AAJ6TL10_POPEU|nr:PREDICTED: uncharacterized protein LOC105116863 [Populus euphratica]XP_011012672.1 PREDICTED: uncharacterized protein LOC105116863 [Populus euphratica]